MATDERETCHFGIFRLNRALKPVTTNCWLTLASKGEEALRGELWFLTDEDTMPHTRTLYCLAEGRGAQWEAVCLNFDLAVHGASFEQVQRKMVEAIHGYLEVIADYEPEERRRFLNRRAPISLWVRFWCVHLCGSVGKWFDGHGGNNKKQLADFRLECPAASPA